MRQEIYHYAALLAATVVLSACGGGGGDDDAGAQADSAACFNVGFYRAGSQINYTQSSRTNNAQIYEAVIFHRVVSQREENGVSTTLVESNAGGAFGNTLYSIDKGALLYHGYGNLDTPLYSSKESLTPARQSVIAMKEGQATTQNIVQTNEVLLKGIYLKQIANVAYTQIYMGRETISTPLGQFSACRFVTTTQTKSESRDRPNPDSDTRTTAWVAAEGPYRGLRLKEEAIIRRYGNADNTESTDTVVTETKQVTLFDLK